MLSTGIVLKCSDIARRWKKFAFIGKFGHALKVISSDRMPSGNLSRGDDLDIIDKVGTSLSPLFIIGLTTHPNAKVLGSIGDVKINPCWEIGL